jgi:hypothetical protein
MKRRSLQTFTIVAVFAFLMLVIADCFAANAVPNSQVKAVRGEQRRL